MNDLDEVLAPYVRVSFSAFTFCRVEVKRVLVVGMGGGVMAGFARRVYPESVIDVVDIDPAAVQAARDYFGFVEDPRMRVHVRDGREFIQKVKEPYDVIFLDVFNGTDAPRHLLTLEFFEWVWHVLRYDGVVVSNILFRSMNPAYDSIVKTQATVFDTVVSVEVPDSEHNRIVLAFPRKVRTEGLSEFSKNNAVAKNFPAGVGRIEQWTVVVGEESLGSILRDPVAPQRAAALRR